MKYRLIGIRPNHEEMQNMIGKYLFRIVDGWLEKCYITDVVIGGREDNYRWQFVLLGEENFKENEPLFINTKSAKRYAKQNNITLKKALN